MQPTINLRTSLNGVRVPLRRPSGVGATGGRHRLTVTAYKKGAGKVKGGYGGTEPNAKKKFCKVDSSGRASKGLGAYRFIKKYGDINDYSPIYDPYTWASGGEVYALGPSGLAAWAGLLAAGLGVSVYLIYITSNIF